MLLAKGRHRIHLDTLDRFLVDLPVEGALQRLMHLLVALMPSVVLVLAEDKRMAPIMLGMVKVAD